MQQQLLPYIVLAFVAVFLLTREILAVMLRLQESFSAETHHLPTNDEVDPNLYGGLLPDDLVRIRMITAVLLGSLGLLMMIRQLAHAGDFGFVIVIMAGLIFLVVVYVSLTLPDAILKMLYERRMRTMNRQLIDAMTVLALALRSGKNFEDALPLVSEEIPSPLGEEFDRVVQEMRVGGVPLDQALKRLVERVPVKDMQIFVSTMNIVQTIGGSQADILERSAELIRERFLILEKCKALTAEGRFTAIAISLAPVFILMVNLLINHEMTAKFVSHPVGILVLISIAISDFIGYKILMSISKSEF